MADPNSDSPSTAGFAQPAGSAGAEQCSANSLLRPQPPTFMEALRFWFKLGFISFGGPAGQIAIMHQELVEHRRWISEHRFLHALNYCMLLPGPEACQLAIYTGWLLHGLRGGLMAGTAVLPAGILPALGCWPGCIWPSATCRWCRACSTASSPPWWPWCVFAAWRIGSRAIKNKHAAGDLRGRFRRHFLLRTSASPGSCWRRASSAPSAAS
jgi:hypothetical protein